MRQGTTPKHTFTLPFDTSSVSVVQVTYKQGDKIILQKKTADCVCEGKDISYTLTQEETFLFNENKPVYIQVRVLTEDKEALTSDLIRVSVSECLDDEVLA